MIIDYLQGTKCDGESTCQGTVEEHLTRKPQNDSSPDSEAAVRLLKKEQKDE